MSDDEKTKVVDRWTVDNMKDSKIRYYDPFEEIAGLRKEVAYLKKMLAEHILLGHQEDN